MGVKANNDFAVTPADTTVNVPVLANDTLDGMPVALEDLVGPPTIVRPPWIGTATVEADGTVTYIPPPGFCGTVSFDYEIESPAPLVMCLCADQPEGYRVLAGIPSEFSKDDPVRLLYGEGQCMTLDYVESGGFWHPGWEEDCPGDEWPVQGATVTIVQGELETTVVVCVTPSLYLSFDGSTWSFRLSGADEDVGSILTVYFPGDGGPEAPPEGPYIAVLDADEGLWVWTDPPPEFSGYTGPLVNSTIDGTPLCGSAHVIGGG